MPTLGISAVYEMAKVKISRQAMGYECDIPLVLFCSTKLDYSGCGTKAQQLRILVNDYDGAIVQVGGRSKPAMNQLDTWLEYHSTVILLPDNMRKAVAGNDT